jgi:hypothetical protein
MLRAVAQAGLADLFLPLPQIVTEMLARLTPSSMKSSLTAKLDLMPVVKP